MEFYEFDDGYLERLRAGDYLTQRHFTEYFGSLIQIKLRKRGVSREDIEDIRQITFLRVLVNLQKANGIREAKAFGSYVNSFCENVFREHLGRRVPEPVDDFTTNNLPARSTNADDAAIRNEEVKIVGEVLDGLLERDRRILRAVFLEERDKDEVCKDFGITRGNLRVIMTRGIKKIQEKLRKRPFGPEGTAAD